MGEVLRAGRKGLGWVPYSGGRKGFPARYARTREAGSPEIWHAYAREAGRATKHTTPTRAYARGEVRRVRLAVGVPCSLRGLGVDQRQDGRSDRCRERGPCVGDAGEVVTDPGRFGWWGIPIGGSYWPRRWPRVRGIDRKSLIRLWLRIGATDC